ncbi:hypothetical protein PHJA_001227600 [Phtheirospermum japonicum]|uniref:Uncharacterized protein n=1 Tax=Phtheirospermum japonicum TaxID=374723 RepID=A0A830BSH5_9LAMI|nr:hypothetical protein PHJA_001227600 [Phtheirospermum japonicum]
MARARLIRLWQITYFLATLLAFVEAQNLINSRKLDEGPPPDLENKCGNCPCDNPCNPPPSPPPPPPPSPPPPAKKQPPSNYCPPPPSGGGHQNPPNPPYAYVNGPPGNVYQVYPYYSGSGRSFSIGIFPFLISSMYGLLAF